MYFCFTGFEGGTCAGDLLGVVDSPPDCCFIPDRGGLGGGSFVASGEEDCISCMSQIGEDSNNNITSIIDLFLLTTSNYYVHWSSKP